MIYNNIYNSKKYKISILKYPQMQQSDKCFHIFYTKDINKKKKVYKEGVLLVCGRTAKIFDEEGQLVIIFKNKQEVLVDQEYTVNNVYSISVDKVGSIQEFNNGTIFTKKQMMVLPIKKAIKPQAKSKSYKEAENIELKSGLHMEKKLYECLRPHQRQGVEFMYTCISGKKNPALNGCILADFMGLGKTLQTLALSYSMVRQKDIKKFVIVCPLTLLNVWQKQTKKWLQDKIAPLVCYGDGIETSETVKKFANFEYRMLIISYQTFHKNMEKISGKCDLIIFDEGHRMKNKKSKLLLKLKSFKCEKRILLTGTPIQNNLQQLYTCISIINPKMFGSQPIFKNVFQKPILQGLAKKATQQQKQLAKARTAQLALQLRQFSLRRTADVLKKFLPPKNQHLIFLKLTPLQHLWYERIVQTKNEKEEDMFKTLNSLRKLFIHPKILKMSKINNGNCELCTQDCNIQKSFKIQFALRIIQECVRKSEKCVVVSYYTQTLDFIGNVLKSQNISSTKLDGRQSIQQRKMSLLKFQKQFPVLLLSGKAGGTGLTLVCAVRMIMIQPDWNPSNDSQVMGRIWRQGQQKEVDIYRLIIASTFQQKMLMRQTLKKALSNNLIDNGTQYQNIDMDNIGKLFVHNKSEVLTYSKNQNQIDSFMKKHQQFLGNQNQNGIIFIKSISSANSNVQTVKQVTDQKQKVNIDENEYIGNQFTNIGLSNFIKVEQESQECSIDLQQQQELSRIQEIQKIKPKEQKTKNNTADLIDKNTNNQSDSKTEKSIIPCLNKQKNQKDKNQKMSRIEQNLTDAQITEIKIVKRDPLQENVIISSKNMKKDELNYGPVNLLKKIVKKQ